MRILGAVLHRPSIVVRDSHAGWSLAPNLRKVVVTGNGGSYRLSTEAHGRRVAYPGERPVPDSTPRVILLGDSFVNAVIVEDEETFAWRLARQFPHVQVVNLGVLGYSPSQELIRLEQFVAENPRVAIGAIVMLITENDFRDAQLADDPFLGRSKPLLRVGASGLERLPYRPAFRDVLMDQSRLIWLVSSKFAIWFAPPPAPMAPGRPVVEAAIAAVRELARSKGARLHLFGYRRVTGSEVDDQLWQQFLGATGAVEITETFRGDPGLIGYDRGHWSAAGHQRAAELFGKALASP